MNNSTCGQAQVARHRSAARKPAPPLGLFRSAIANGFFLTPAPARAHTGVLRLPLARITVANRRNRCGAGFELTLTGSLERCRRHLPPDRTYHPDAIARL